MLRLPFRLPALDPAAYRRITLVTLVALCFIIVTGGAVRLTGSGLGCSDWPGCEREQFIAPLELHPMVEFVNRVITGVVSVSIALAVLGSLRLRDRRTDLTALSLGLVAGVVAQILLGALTVAFELAPPFVMGHFLVSLVLVTNAVVLFVRAGEPATAPAPAVGPGLRRLAFALAPALAVAVVAGTVVTGTGPHGGDEDAVRFGFDIEVVARVHSLAVLAFVGLLLVVLGRAVREGAPPAFLVRARWLLGLAVAQAGLGWVQYFSGVPVVLVGLHILGATLVWTALCFVLLACRTRPEPADGAASAPVGSGALVGQT